MAEEELEAAETAEEYDDIEIELEEGPVAYLERGELGEKIYLELPARLGTGAAATCRVTGNPLIYRQHAEFLMASGRCMIKDLTCDANAIFVNNKGLPARGTRFLKKGAVLTIGNEDFVFGDLLPEEETAQYWQDKRERLRQEAIEARKAAEAEAAASEEASEE